MWAEGNTADLLTLSREPFMQGSRAEQSSGFLQEDSSLKARKEVGAWLVGSLPTDQSTKSLLLRGEIRKGQRGGGRGRRC